MHFFSSLFQMATYYRKQVRFTRLAVAVISMFCILYTAAWGSDNLLMWLSRSAIEPKRPPHLNVVYIKTHKCASETLSAVFRRFGLERNLSFVLPVSGRNNLGWPDLLQPGMYRPSKSGQYNMLTEHTVFNEKIMAAMMPNDTVFISSIREPFSHFKSAFYYFNLPKVAAIKTKDPLGEYIRHLQRYDDIYKSHNATRHRSGYCVPPHLSVTRNSMAFDLGFPNGYHKGWTDQTANETAVADWIKTIDKRFALMIIVEYFDASMILLKRLLSWSTKDILYQKRNPQRSGPAAATRHVTESLIGNYKRWSHVDYALYDHFNKSFWEKISRQNHFWDEVNEFVLANTKVNAFCTSQRPTVNKTLLLVEQSQWHDAFNVSKKDCVLLSSRLMPELKKQYDIIPVKVKKRKEVGSTC